MRGRFDIYEVTEVVYLLSCGECGKTEQGRVSSVVYVPHNGWYQKDDGPNGGGLVLCPDCGKKRRDALWKAINEPD